MLKESLMVDNKKEYVLPRLILKIYNVFYLVGIDTSHINNNDKSNYNISNNNEVNYYNNHKNNNNYNNNFNAMHITHL